jgi:hypothetical protein
MRLLVLHGETFFWTGQLLGCYVPAGTWKVRATNKEFTMSRNSYAAINAIFECDLAHSGGVVRRSVKFIEDNGLRDDLEREVKERGCRLLIIAGYYLIVCNGDLDIKVRV